MREVSGTGSSSQEVGSQVGRSAVCLGTDRRGSLLANVLVIVLYKVSFLVQRERERGVFPKIHSDINCNS